MRKFLLNFEGILTNKVKDRMLTFIILSIVSLMILTFLLLRKDVNMFTLLKMLLGKFAQPAHHQKHHQNNIQVLEGELIVTGDDEIHIELPKHPKEILVAFGRHCEVTPCNPRHHDKLKYYICNFHRKSCLVIKWDVSNSRKVIWQVRF